ncbi:Uncharacterised protein [Candidatus Tiddalikarchaeum anstoanum]|nr:Uncharacterised protein [Candidatus Tiddalikarchaeum anstoanum]
MMTRKAQSALEYLITYGWAILIIVIVGAALFALGVFNPGGSTALQVRGLSNFQVDDAKMSPNGNLTLVLGVKTGKTTFVTEIDFAVLGGSCSKFVAGPTATIPASQTQLLVMNPGAPCGLATGDQLRVATNITYTVAGSSLVHLDTGEITVTVQN